MDSVLRVLYVCYLSLEDPLVDTQVVAYLERLARGGHTIHLLTFDPELGVRRRGFREDMARRGISWHSLPYHKRPSLAATIYDTLAGAAMAAWIVRKEKLEAIHARNHVPAAMALMVRRVTGCRLIFDIRGLMAEQYVEAGSWRRGGLPYRLTQWVQDRAVLRADAVVMLTNRVRRDLFGERPPDTAEVIPCCADLERLAAKPDAAAELGEDLGIAGRPVMAYVGKLSGRYMTEEMVRFFAVARRAQPSLAFLVLTQEPADALRAELVGQGISDSEYRITRAAPEEIGRYLATASFGVFLYRSGFSDIAVSPTKVGEYLGAGLPLVSGPGVGDTDALVRENGVGVIVEDHTDRGFEAAAREILQLAADPACRERCRAVAEENFSLRRVGVPRYDRVYRSVAAAAAANQRRAGAPSKPLSAAR